MTDQQPFPLLTRVNIDTKFRFTYKNFFLFIGSCFSEHIASATHELGFKTLSNPFGITYNPISIAGQLDVILNKKQYTAADLHRSTDHFLSWDHHGSFRKAVADEMLVAINTPIEQANKILSPETVMVLTLGTALIHRLISDGRVVNNCHKYPAAHFSKQRLSVSQVVDALKDSLEKLLQHWPGIQIIFTVSPVRHTRDGLHENQLSKSVLLLAIDELCQAYPEAVDYFPAYELMMDELRDYRFYDASYLHPDEVAINYIREKWKHHLFETATINKMAEVEKYNRLRKHRILFPCSAEALRHAEKLKGLYSDLINKYPEIRFQKPCQ